MENTKPNLPKRLFWEFKYEDIDWHKEYAAVIERVIERGTESEWSQLINFYGKDKVINTLKDETNYLPDEIIDDVCTYFKQHTTLHLLFVERLNIKIFHELNIKFGA
jgi:hypothetical protein